MNHQVLSSFIWSVADVLRGDYKQSDYGKVILPLTVLRRLYCILAPTKETVLAEKVAKEAMGMNPAPFLAKTTGQSFYNTSPIDLKKLMGDQDNIAANLPKGQSGQRPGHSPHKAPAARKMRQTARGGHRGPRVRLPDGQ